MRKLFVLSIVAAFALAAFAPALAGDEAKKEVQLTGYITDEWCGKANANAQGAGCAKACAKKGSDLAVFADGKMYKLSNKEMALEHLGYEVVVTGTLDESGTVQVASIAKAKKDA